VLRQDWTVIARLRASDEKYGMGKSGPADMR
jgi:hypothetical protein